MEVAPDARHVGDHVEPVLAQVVGRPDAGEQQELRRADGAAREQHLAGLAALDPTVARPLDADAARAREQQPARLCARRTRRLGWSATSSR